MSEIDTDASDKDASGKNPDPQSASQIEPIKVSRSRRPSSPAWSLDQHRDSGLRTEYFISDDDNIWSIPWANLMMVLFAIVFMLISLQSRDSQTQTTVVGMSATHQPASQQSVNPVPIGKAHSTDTVSQLSLPSAATAVTPTSLLVHITKSLGVADNGQVTTTQMPDQSIKLSLAADMLFESNTAQLTQQAHVILDQVSGLLHNMQRQIHIVGHTDDQAVASERYQDNWALSLARASAVTRYLIDPGKINGARFIVSGRAQYAPLASNLIASSRAMNRRVDIIITPGTYPPVESKS